MYTTVVAPEVDTRSATDEVTVFVAVVNVVVVVVVGLLDRPT